MVGAGDPKDYTGALGVVIARNPLCSLANDVEHWSRPARSVIPQTLPNFLRCDCAGTPEVVSARNFSAVALGAGHGKSAPGIRGALNRYALQLEWIKSS